MFTNMKLMLPALVAFTGLLTLISIAAQNVTLARGSYQHAIALSTACAVLSIACSVLLWRQWRAWLLRTPLALNIALALWMIWLSLGRLG